MHSPCVLNVNHMLALVRTRQAYLIRGSKIRLYSKLCCLAAEKQREPTPQKALTKQSTGAAMAWFNIFKKREPAVPLPQLCYDIAYFVLPHYAHADFAKLDDICRQTPSSAGPFFYVMACQMRKIEPDIETAKMFQWHVGSLNGEIDYLTLSYPTPPPVDMSNVSPEELINSRSPLVLAPYFSTVLRDRENKREYYILGQSPIGGGTTLRTITAFGANCNLGPGPNPTIEEFHAALSRTAESE